MADRNFYLGRQVSDNEDFLYPADHLTTHGMVFGMTGSGKTGLCLDLLEEAIDKEIPLILIDPKGDLVNLALLFPEFAPTDFLPWVSATEASKKGISPEEYAAKEAEKWQKGLESWGVSKERVQAIKDKADLRIFTPGSSAGNRISILEGFKKPEMDFTADEELMVEKIRSSVSALLALLDVDNDPLKSKPHILISNIIEHYWRLGRSLSIADLIINIQKPPIQKLGVFDVNTFIDEKERIELAFQLNSVVASPTFRFWSTGMPLDAGELYKQKNGKVPVNIFYIAHLSDNERMFMVTLLLNEVVHWLRGQSGSTNLKYLLYMDEIFGYLPPYPKNPPTKTPLLTLLKQARAFGLGVTLATQNPKDIDYKALTNMGTWFVGKLQAEGDRERVLEGMAGLSDATGVTVDDDRLQEMLSDLGKRQFLVKDVHAKGIKVFQTRWAMSYLAGPVTREQIKTLAIKIPQPQATPAPGTIGAATAPGGSTASTSAPQAAGSGKHLLPYQPKIEAALDVLYNNSGEGNYYAPRLYMDGEVLFDDKPRGVYIRKPFVVVAPMEEGINWRRADIGEEERDYDTAPMDQIQGYEPLKTKVKFSLVKKHKSEFKNFLFTQLALELFYNKELNLVSEAEETREAFTQKCRDVVEKMIDKEVDRVKESFEKKIDRIEDRIDQEKLKLERLEQEHKSKRTEELLSVGESVLSMFLGGKSRKGLSSAARRRRRTSSAKGKVKIKQERLTQLEEDLEELQMDLEDKVADVEDRFYNLADDIETLEVRLEKNDIIISRVAMLWQLS